MERDSLDLRVPEMAGLEEVELSRFLGVFDGSIYGYMMTWWARHLTCCWAWVELAQETVDLHRLSDDQDAVHRRLYILAVEGSIRGGGNLPPLKMVGPFAMFGFGNAECAFLTRYSGFGSDGGAPMKVNSNIIVRED